MIITCKKPMQYMYVYIPHKGNIFLIQKVDYFQLTQK